MASRNLGDPNFRESVVLLTRYNAAGATGLIVNRPTNISVNRFLPAVKSGASVYFGGPVELNTLIVLHQTESAASDRILPGVFMTTQTDAVRKAAAAAPGAKGARVFAGYAGWGAGQLDSEMMMGSWHVFAGDARVVFHSDPESVWQRMIRRTELMIASVLPARHSVRRSH